MSHYYVTYPQFHSGQSVISIAEHLPEIKPGTMAEVVSPWVGSLCAVQLPNGEIHRWFASFELAPANLWPNFSASLAPGNYATIISNVGHGDPPHIAVGTMVRIVKCIPQTIFYDLMIHGQYHRWLAEFELAAPLR